MIRRWTADDALECYAVYVDAVHNGTDRHYDAAQRAAWVSSQDMEDWWEPRLSEAESWIASDRTGITGLISLRGGSYLDLFFVAPRARGDGTAVALYETLLVEAKTREATTLTTHASDYLKPFLEKRGWRVDAEELVDREGVTLRRWEMSLDQSAGSQRS